MNLYNKINNENYGFSVATRDKWLVVGNPSFYSWPPAELGVATSGSVDVFLYSKRYDQHLLQNTLFRHLLADEEILLAAETGSGGQPPTGSIISGSLHTEATGSFSDTADSDIILDYGTYLSGSVNDYGRAVDIHNRLLGIGYTYNRLLFQFDSGTLDISSSGGVDMYDLGVYDPDTVSFREVITSDSYSGSDGYYYFMASVPPGYSAVALQRTTDLVNWNTIQTLSTDYEAGGQYAFRFPQSEYVGNYRLTESVDYDPYILTLTNPVPTVTGSFGWAVSINDDWVAVGSPFYSSSRGAVHMFRKFGGTALANLSWSLHSTITASDAQPGDLFGYSLELNSAPGVINYTTRSVAYSQSMVIGTHRPSGSKVYYYEISGSGGLSGSISSASWQETFYFTPTYTNLPLTYYPDAYPILSSSWAGPSPVADMFGYDVSIYGDTVAIGAPFDRYYFEYTQSAVYQQGAFYVFERCPVADYGFSLNMKSHGTEDSLKNHRLGYSLDTYAGKLVVGCPKLTTIQMGSSSLSPCYIQGSLYQAHFCRTEEEYQIQGQYCYLQYNTGSNLWEYNNTYQIKKRYLAPYRNFGWGIDMSDRFIVVGSPMNISGSKRTIDIYYTGSNLNDFDPISGQAYIYNLANYKSEFQVGNVFYRNGKIVIITSGSQFDGLFFNPISDADYQYDLMFHNKQTLHEKQIICSVEPGEFNVSTNPSSTSITRSLFDINQNGVFDFQDVDVLLMYMNYKRTEGDSDQNSNWSASVLIADDEICWHDYLKNSGNFYGTNELYSSSFAWLNTTAMYSALDFNQDNIIDVNDQNILWKYFSNRLNQTNFDKYLTTNSSQRLYSSTVDQLNAKTNRNHLPTIRSEFFDYDRLSKNDQTGSYLTPYVTSIGLYQDGELAAIAKLGSPIKLLPDYPYNFVVKMDF